MNTNKYIGVAVVLFIVVGVFWLNGLWFNTVSLDSNFQITGKQVEDVVDDTAILLLGENENLGVYIVDSNGRALYTTSVGCTGECLNVWPPYISIRGEVNIDSGLGTELREDVKVYQFTWNGEALYYFVQDIEDGDVNGDGFNGVWSVARP